VNNNYTQPKKIGTTRQRVWDASANLKWQMNDYNSLFAKAQYFNRSLDGIEYVQVWDSSHEVAQWVVISKSVRSNFSTEQMNFSLDYMNHDGGNAYSWLAGVDVNYEKLEDVYYLPVSEQMVENLNFTLKLKKNFSFGENMILVGVNGGLKSNLDGSHNYQGIHSASKIYTDMVLRDYHFLINDAYSLGGELSYTRKGIVGNNSSLFVAATFDCHKAISAPAAYPFGDRKWVVVKAGLTF
jgi:hypothetical protein